MEERHVIEALVCDRHARRELLWLRAKERGDDASARDLERVDPAIVERLSAAGLDVADRCAEPPAVRSDRYGRLFDACFEHHVALLAGNARASPPSDRQLSD